MRRTPDEIASGVARIATLAVGLLGFVFFGNLLGLGVDRRPRLPFGGALLVNVILLTYAAIGVSRLGWGGLRRRFRRRFSEETADHWLRFLAVQPFAVLMLGWQPLGGDLVRWTGAPALLLGWVAIGGWALLALAGLAADGFRPPGQGIYRFLRQPAATGALIVAWATPEITVSRLFLATVLTALVGLATYVAEMDRSDRWGWHYVPYRGRVPLLWPRGRALASARRLFSNSPST